MLPEVSRLYNKIQAVSGRKPAVHFIAELHLIRAHCFNLLALISAAGDPTISLELCPETLPRTGFPTRGAKQHLRGCEMVIQTYMLHYCTVMLSPSCANCFAQSVSNYYMPSAR